MKSRLLYAVLGALALTTPATAQTNPTVYGSVVFGHEWEDMEAPPYGLYSMPADNGNAIKLEVRNDAIKANGGGVYVDGMYYLVDFTRYEFEQVVTFRTFDTKNNWKLINEQTGHTNCAGLAGVGDGGVVGADHIPIHQRHGQTSRNGAGNGCDGVDYRKRHRHTRFGRFRCRRRHGKRKNERQRQKQRRHFLIGFHRVTAPPLTRGRQYGASAPYSACDLLAVAECCDRDRAICVAELRRFQQCEG